MKMSNNELREKNFKGIYTFCPNCGSYNLLLDPLGEENIKVFCEDCGEDIFDTVSGFLCKGFAISPNHWENDEAIILPVVNGKAVKGNKEDGRD